MDRQAKTALVAVAALAISTVFVAPAQARRGSSRSATVQVEMNNFATEQSKLRSQVSGSLASGRLTPSQAAQITAQLDQLAAQTNQAYASGMLSDQLAWQFVDRFNSIQNQLNIADSNPYYSPAAQGAPSTPMNVYGQTPYGGNLYGYGGGNPYGMNPYGYRFY